MATGATGATGAGAAIGMAYELYVPWPPFSFSFSLNIIKYCLKKPSFLAKSSKCLMIK